MQVVESTHRTARRQNRISALGIWIGSGAATAATTLFGLLSLICLLAIMVNVPVVQLAVLGYFFESSRRIAVEGKWSSGFIGLKTAATLGRWILCIALLLIPIRILSGHWIDATVIDPTSQQAFLLLIAYRALAVVTTVYILSALACGGKLSHFFWPLVVPFWMLSRICKRILRFSRRPSSRSSLSMSKADEGNSKYHQQPTQWFVPLLVWRKLRAGTFFAQSRDQTLGFLQRLQLPYFLWMGFKGFIGSMIWLLLPTMLLANANHPRTGVGGVSIALGVLVAIPVFMALPMLQMQFAVEKKFRSLFNFRSAWSRIRRAPLASFMALLLMLLAVPLFLLKIEKIPTELFWLLSVLFVVLGWPARIAWGWVYRYAQGRAKEASRKVRWPLGILGGMIVASFAFIFFLTRYTSWNGTLSLFENHVFLLPMPFWF